MPAKTPLSTDLRRVQKALFETGGNITRAGTALGVSKPYMMVLVKRHALSAWAKQLREESGMAWTGRPRKIAVPSAHD